MTRIAQVAHMGPAACPPAPVIGLVALGRPRGVQALRRAGAAADVGAAAEAALGEDPATHGT